MNIEHMRRLFTKTHTVFRDCFVRSSLFWDKLFQNSCRQNIVFHVFVTLSLCPRYVASVNQAFGVHFSIAHLFHTVQLLPKVPVLAFTVNA